MAEFEKYLLCVDDELQILNALKRCLRKEPYTLLTASSAKEGLELIEKNPVGVVITDYRMPEMNGLELATIIKEKYPDIVTMILSGYTDPETMASASSGATSSKGFRYLFKPWDDEKLKEEIRNSFNLLKMP